MFGIKTARTSALPCTRTRWAAKAFSSATVKRSRATWNSRLTSRDQRHSSPHRSPGCQDHDLPQPLLDRISVRLENVNEGKAVIQLLDFSGNVLRSDMVFVKNHEGEITFETRDIERPGYYALRVIQGDSVKNTTIMKR